MLEAFLVSTGAVALAEIGDKTQLLALMLAARFQRPVPIIAAIFAATVLNHAIAGAVGAWLATFIGPDGLRWILGIGVIAMAIWTFVPDNPGDESKTVSRYGVFVTTLVAFFLLEIGDKTQVATVVLAAKYPSLVAVVMGTTLGMLLANVPVVLAGRLAAEKLPFKWIRMVAAAIFVVLGVVTLVGPKFSFGLGAAGL